MGKQLLLILLWIKGLNYIIHFLQNLTKQCYEMCKSPLLIFRGFFSFLFFLSQNVISALLKLFAKLGQIPKPNSP